MKLLIFSDVHWSRASSIVRQQGMNYSLRLERLIESMNWVNAVAEANKCDCLVCAGDMMDKSYCNDEELTSLGEIKWANMPCLFLCGNHESSVSDLRYSSVSPLLGKYGDYEHKLIIKPCCVDAANTQIHFIPYITESDRLDIVNYITDVDKTKKQICISHNDIKGIQYGVAVSKYGFNIEEIESNFDLYLNGHLHNTTKLTKKIINVGSLTAHNFTNDSFDYKYGVWLVDTDTLETTFIENPYGFSFYKIEIKSQRDLDIFNRLKDNAVISIKCTNEMLPEVREALKVMKNIIDYKLTLSAEELTTVSESSIEDLAMDHLGEFVKFCEANIVNTQILQEELQEICK